MAGNDNVKRGFTVIEVVIALAIIVVITLFTVILINPSEQLAKGRNTQRLANIYSLINAVGQNIADNKGVFACVTGPIPTSTETMATGAGNYNIGSCLVPAYLPNLPYDPSASGSRFTSLADYNTGYTIVQSTTTGRVTINAPSAELGQTIAVTR